MNVGVVLSETLFELEAQVVERFDSVLVPLFGRVRLLLRLFVLCIDRLWPGDAIHELINGRL